MIPGAVLAGGQSTRMGQDKALIEISGLPLASYMASILAAGGCAPVLAVGRQEALQDLPLDVLATESQIEHPLTGIIAALEHFHDSLVLCCPVDLPNLLADHIARLLAEDQPCVATNGREIQPLLCVLGPEHLAKARALLHQGAPARALVQDLRRVALSVEALHNCNHPHDFNSITRSH